MPNNLSMSMAGKCRMALWLGEHLPQSEEPVLPGTQRTFDVGHMVEKLFFEEVPIMTHRLGPDGETERIGGWWNRADRIMDPISGWSFDPKVTPVTDRQKLVEIGVFKGHIDGLIEPELFPGVRTKWNLDIKTAGGFQYDRAVVLANFMDDVFLKEYAIAQNLYVHAQLLAGDDIRGSCLVFFNKEQSKIAARFLPYDRELAEQGLERLTAGLDDAEPYPDYEWKPNDLLPLRCSYCDFKTACAQTRGVKLEGPVINKRGKPEWRSR